MCSIVTDQVGARRPTWHDEFQGVASNGEFRLDVDVLGVAIRKTDLVMYSDSHVFGCNGLGKACTRDYQNRADCDSKPNEGR